MVTKPSWWQRMVAFLAPAFDDAWTYLMGLFGVLSGPFVTGAATFKFELQPFVLAAVGSVLVTGFFELKGDAAGKKTVSARKRRYFFAFVVGLLGQAGVGKLLDLIQGLGGIG